MNICRSAFDVDQSHPVVGRSPDGGWWGRARPLGVRSGRQPAQRHKVAEANDGPDDLRHESLFVQPTAQECEPTRKSVDGGSGHGKRHQDAQVRLDGQDARLGWQVGRKRLVFGTPLQTEPTQVWKSAFLRNVLG